MNNSFSVHPMLLVDEAHLLSPDIISAIRFDSGSGDVWVKDPFGCTGWWHFTLGESLEDKRHSMIVVGTRSLAASFDNFSAMAMEMAMEM